MPRKLLILVVEVVDLLIDSLSCFLCLRNIAPTIIVAINSSIPIPSPIGRGSLGVSAQPGIPTSSSGSPLPPEPLLPEGLFDDGVPLPKGV